MSTYTPIAIQTLSANATSATFSGIPQNYTDLVCIFNSASTIANNSLGIQFNSDNGNNYSNTDVRGNGSTTASSRYNNQSAIYVASSIPVTSTVGNAMYKINIMNYSISNTFKTVLAKNSSAENGAELVVGLWRNTNPIDTITISYTGGNLISGSTLSLYGISAGSPKATGGSVTTDGTYWYHTFRSSGAFVTSQALTVDYLVVAGGGGGNIGNDKGGGGGAGGLRSTVTATGGGGSLESALSLTSGTTHIVTVGAGGAVGVNGSNSVFSTITSIGGGAGGGQSNGSSGGSGGGGGTKNTGTLYTGGSGTANQGYSGGNGQHTPGINQSAGGGGGAGSVGGNRSGDIGGAGGSGVAVSITGSSVTYAGGGGGGSVQVGGTGGSGGGGTGANDVGSPNATAGTTNRGGGGGGGSTSNAAAGGSGIVIVRYTV